MIDKKVVVVATGGTIAMKYDPEKDGLAPVKILLLPFPASARLLRWNSFSSPTLLHPV